MRTTWTAKEANKSLPLVKRIVADILSCGREWRELSQEIEGEPPNGRLAYLEERLTALMRELERIGCYYKDWGFDMGLIDFPAKIDGQLVFLCWRSDETAITHYHPRDEGFAGRRPIPAEELE